MLIGYAVAISIFAVLSVPGPIGSDTYWHIHISEMIAEGNPDHALQYVLEQNKFPYGAGLSLFHFAEVPLVWSGQPLLAVRILEILFMPCTYALTLYLVYKHGGGAKPAAITGIILFGGWAFMDGALQARPESIDLLLYPITILALLTYRKKTFLATSILTIYSHGVAALSIIFGAAAYKLTDKSWRKTILLALILILPVIAVSCYYVGGAFDKWGGAPPMENPQEYEFWTTPLTFIPIYAGTSLLGIPYLFRSKKTELETLLTWGLLGSLIMLPIWPDRWLHYASIPLSILAGMGISRMQGKKLFFTGVFVLMVFMLFYATWLQMSITGAWWQPGD